jgi:hypothetical protein
MQTLALLDRSEYNKLMPEISGAVQEIPRNPDGTFPKGVSGNPAGKPVGAKHMTTKLMEAITRVSADGGTSDDIQIVKTLVEKAKGGDMRGIELILNYVDGKPKQSEGDLGTAENPIHTVHKVIWE